MIARADGSVALQPRGRGRRPRHGDHARRARRGPPLEHAQAAAHLRGARRRAARPTRTCRCCTARTARSSPSATAPRRSRSSATPGYLPEAVRNYLALLGWGDADDDDDPHDVDELIERFDVERVSKNPAQLRRAEAALDQRPLRARAVDLDELTARLEGSHGPRAASSRRGDLPQEKMSDARRLLAAGRLPLRRARDDDPKAREKWLDDEGRAALAARAGRAGRSAGVRRSSHRRRAARRGRAACESSRSRSSSRCASRSPEPTVSPGIFETARRPGARRDARVGSTRR